MSLNDSYNDIDNVLNDENPTDLFDANDIGLNEPDDLNDLDDFSDIELEDDDEDLDKTVDTD